MAGNGYELMINMLLFIQSIQRFRDEQAKDEADFLNKNFEGKELLTDSFTEKTLTSADIHGKAKQCRENDRKTTKSPRYSAFIRVQFISVR